MGNPKPDTGKKGVQPIGTVKPYPPRPAIRPMDATVRERLTAAIEAQNDTLRLIVKALERHAAHVPLDTIADLNGCLDRADAILALIDEDDAARMGRDR